MKTEKIASLGLLRQKINFGKKKEEHKSWGGRIDEKTNSPTFKLFTYPDAQSVNVLIENMQKTQAFPLEDKGKGIFEAKNLPEGAISDGDKYQYEILKSDGKTEIIKDPYSFRQDEVNGPTIFYDHSKFNWQNDEKWQKSSNRITREGKNGHKACREAKIYALNPDTINDKRSYEGVKDKLKEIKKMGFNTVEIMHVENTYSFNWGYDGVDKHAPSAYLGGPDGLKSLVDAIHGEDMNVVFDVIPNHLGPDGNQLGRSGPYVKGPNSFGDALNYEGENSEYVRDYMINAMLNWVENYHVDGLRLDMTKYMESDYTLKQLASEMNYHYPDCFLIAEDGRGGISVDGKGNFWQNNDEVHDKRVTSPIKPEEAGIGENEEVHTQAIEKIINGQTNLANLGMNSEWDFNFYHELDESLYHPETDGLVKAALCAQDNVKYIASHDEIGNFEGTRKLAKLMVPHLRLNDNIILSTKDIERAKEYAEMKHKSFEDALQIITFQKAQFASEGLALKQQKGELNQYKIRAGMTPAETRLAMQKFRKEVLLPLGIDPTSNITQKKVEKAFEKSFEQNRMALAFTYGVPGPKMVFQGDENLDITPFRFFRKFESVPHEDYLFVEKGYPPAEAALEESTLGKIQYSENGKKIMNNYAKLTKDLNKLNDENKALSLGYIDPDTIVEHPMSSVVGMNSKYEDNEIFMITNFSDVNYRESKDNEYYIKFPKGTWVEVLNTNDSKYGGDDRHKNTEPINGDGCTNRPINLSRYSTIYFKRIS